MIAPAPKKIAHPFDSKAEITVQDWTSLAGSAAEPACRHRNRSRANRKPRWLDAAGTTSGQNAGTPEPGATAELRTSASARVASLQLYARRVHIPYR